MKNIAILTTGLAASIVAVVVATQAPPQTAQPQPVSAEFDLVTAENGGRIEWTNGEYPPTGAAMNAIAQSKYGGGWVGYGEAPREIVFSFFSRQSALVASVQINPITKENHDRPKDIEIWTSMESSTAGFAKVASASLKKEDALQTVAFPPVEAKFVKLRILSTVVPGDWGNPGQAPGVGRVRIIEGTRPGYTSLLTRSPDLAALAKGTLPAPPPSAALPVPSAQVPLTCAVPTDESRKKPTFPQSQHVLIVADQPNMYRTIAWKSSETDKSYPQGGRPIVEGVDYRFIPPTCLTPAALISEPKIDTVVFAQACEINDDLPPPFKQALLAWVANGHKVIFQDSDNCAGNRTPKYPFLPYPFATVNPGASGAKGEAGVLENSTLASEKKTDPSFIDTDAWKAGPNDLGDSNVVVQYDARWCGAMWAKNKLGKNGFALAYAHYGRGLLIYDGFDSDQNANQSYQHLVVNELKQSFDPDYLPCAQPMAGFIITARPQLASQPMAADKTFTYPISVLGNYGYAGRVTLEAGVVPADPTISVKLDSTVADLTNVEQSTTSLTVTTSAKTTLASKAIAVRGRDEAGKANVLCLTLPERKTGALKVVSELRKDKPPTKNLEIILDASGSMKLMLGTKTRWATAQGVLKDVVSKLPKDFSVGLRTYGHTLPSTNPGTCKDTALIVPVVPLNAPALLDAAAKLTPRGETPLVYSILQTPADLKPAGGGTVILITDGEESCKGDVAAAAKTLKDAGLNLTLDIVGFTLKNLPAQQQLSGLAESTGGHYYGASSGDALSRAVLLSALDKLPYRILDATGKEVARGEAGITDPHELAPGNYTVVITAAEQDVRAPVTVALGQDITLRALVKGDKLIVER